MAFFVFEKEIVEPAGPESVFSDLLLDKSIFDSKEPDRSITWMKFTSTFSSLRRNDQSHFENGFKNKIIEWEGEVLRVDAEDEDVDLEEEGE